MDRPELRMYVDENGHYNLREDLTNDNNRFLCLTGVVMKLETHDQLTRQFDLLKIQYFGSKDIVLHRREIIAGRPPFEALKNDQIREAFNADLLKIISDLKYGVISVVIDKKTLVDKYSLLKAQDPYALALEYLMQRYLYWLEEYEKRYGLAKGDILAEARGGKEDRITSETYRQIYMGKGYNRLDKTQKYFSSKEIKLKKKSANIAGLQLVDLLSHPARRYILSEYDLAKNLSKTSFEKSIVDILVKSKFRRQGKRINGIGAVLFPK